MRILILSLYYHPEPVARPHDLAVTLKQLGHDVRVVTGFPSYPQGKLYPGYQRRARQREVMDGVRVARVAHGVDRSRSAIRRLFSYTSFALAAGLAGAVEREKPDVVWTYQIGLPGVLLGALRGTPVVHEVQDLWPEWGQMAKVGLKGQLYRLLDAQERFIYRQARAVVTITESFKSILIQKGVPADKITIIPNWANETNFHPSAYDPTLAAAEGLDGRFNVMYVGNLGAAQGLGVLLEAASLLHEEAHIQFVIIGDGVERPALERQARQAGLRNVRFLGSRPQFQVAGYLGLADVLFLHLKRDPVFAITIPSKTYGYLAAGKPLLAAAEGELARLVDGLGAGLVCPPEDAPALAAAVRCMARLSEAERAGMGQRGYQAVTTIYSRTTLGQQYSDLFEAVVSLGKEGTR